MVQDRLRRLFATHCLCWCAVVVLLTAIQPFLFAHFRHDGWEDEPGFRIRNTQSIAMFGPDDRPDHAKELETTLAVPLSAQLDAPELLQQGIDCLLALIALLLPVTITLLMSLVPKFEPVAARIRPQSGGPPATSPWRTQPPTLAPPLTT